MVTPKEARALKKIESLRNRRLHLADLEVARANAGVDSATQGLSEARLSLSRTDEFCRAEHKRLNEELSAQPVDKDRIYEWREAHKRLDQRLDTAKKALMKAKEHLQTQRQWLERARAQQRAVALDVERLKILLG